METPLETLRQEALTALARGDARGAFSRFRQALEYPGAPELARPGPWRQALDTLAALCAAIAGEPLAELVREARDDDTQALCDLGFELMEHRLYGIAATVLRRGHQLEPRSHLLFVRLGSALTNQGLHAEAIRHLRGAPGAAEQNHLSRYLLAFNLLMTGDLEATRALLPGLPALRDRHEDGQDVDPSDADAERSLEEMVARADAVRDVTPLHTRDLRGWHFALTGGVLLHLSPYGFDEGMNGRYAYVSDSEERCREGIHRVAEVLRAAELTPPRVFVLPERSSAILAHATAQVLGLPAVPWPAEGSTEPGLVVAYALDELEPSVLETLAAHHPGQLLWCHALCWTEPEPRCALSTPNSSGATSPEAQGAPARARARNADRGPPVACPCARTLTAGFWRGPWSPELGPGPGGGHSVHHSRIVPTISGLRSGHLQLRCWLNAINGMHDGPHERRQNRRRSLDTRIAT